MMIEDQSDSTKIKLLKAKFIGIGEVRGFSFKRVKSNKFVYLYQIDDTYFEVFKRVINTRYNNESYPSANQFGITAFTVDTEDKALLLFKKLTKEYKK